jgi:AraC-like DNA-binding protein
MEAPASNISSGTRSGGREAARIPGDLLNRVGAICLVPGLLAEWGVDPAPVFAAAGATMAMFADRETLVPLTTLARVVSLSVEASGRRDLGLMIALRARADHLGLLGDLFGRAETLRSGLNHVLAYLHLNLRGAVARLDVDDETVEIQITLPEALGDADHAFEDLAVAVFFHAMKRYLGSRWRPHEVRFSHRPPDDLTPYRRLFGEAVGFDALNGAIAFAAADLERSMTVHDRRRRRLEAAARAASSRLGVSFEEQVRWAIHAHLFKGAVTIEDVAHDLGLARRTLNRRLAARGLTFSGLLKEVRFATARRLLSQSTTPLAEIATAIGYSEPSVFSNAFRRWSGETPRTWRAANAAG